MPRKAKEPDGGLPVAQLAFLRVVLDSLPDHVYVKDRAGRYLLVNEAGLRQRKLASLDQIVGKTVYDLVPREAADRMSAEDEAIMQSGEPLVNREAATAFAGAPTDPAGERWHLTSKIPLRDAAGRIVGIIGINRDISARKRAELALRESEERFRHLAHYDGLTSLPNRALFYDRLKQAIAQAARQGWILGVMLVDLDHFKEVNDSLGHAAGDLLLNQVAARLSSAVRSGDTVARLGGDEFAVILGHLTAPADAGIVAQKILALLAEPFALESRSAAAGASIGIALYPADGADQDALVKGADAAMYRAKSAGRNGYRFQGSAMNARAAELAGVEGDLRRALARGELVLHYQPQIALATGELAGAEALLRWMHPQRGLLAPAAFLPLVEEGGLMAELGAWILEQACTALRSWRAGGLAPLPIAVNLFPRQIVRRDLASIVNRLLGASGAEPRLLRIEITEAALLRDAESALRTLAELQALGVSCSLDDFGSGHSSLAVLRRLPLHALKIGRSFVGGLPDDADARAISRAAIALAHCLGLQAIAVGVESEAQLAFLREQRCDLAQGYHFARAMPAGDLQLRLTAARRTAG